MKILGVEPFFGGSHRRFLESILKHSRHDWHLLTGTAVHWKWRMRSAPLVMASQAKDCLLGGFRPDALFCTDMLDLPAFLGLLGESAPRRWPSIIYFHENQWTYPVAPQSRVDHHYGYTNLISALAAHSVVFNSRFHQRDFYSASEAFLKRMPDSVDAHDLDHLSQNSHVIAPGFEPRFETLETEPIRKENQTLTLGWVARWEHDKRPDQFLSLLEMLEDQNIPFRLVLLGPRPRKESRELQLISQRFAAKIDHNGFAQSSDEYWRQLTEIDVVVSTADHEYFGIAICEAIWAGAIPLLPNRLSYPELAPSDCLYDTLDEAVRRVETLQDPRQRDRLRAVTRSQVKAFQSVHTVRALDRLIESTVKQAV